MRHATPELPSAAQGMANMGGGGPAPQATEKDTRRSFGGGGVAFRSQPPGISLS